MAPSTTDGANIPWLLVGHDRKGMVTLGGATKMNETPEHCAAREGVEETAGTARWAGNAATHSVGAIGAVEEELARSPRFELHDFTGRFAVYCVHCAPDPMLPARFRLERRSFYLRNLGTARLLGPNTSPLEPFGLTILDLPLSKWPAMPPLNCRILIVGE